MEKKQFQYVAGCPEVFGDWCLYIYFCRSLWLEGVVVVVVVAGRGDQGKVKGLKHMYSVNMLYLVFIT